MGFLCDLKVLLLSSIYCEFIYHVRFSLLTDLREQDTGWLDFSHNIEKGSRASVLSGYDRPGGAGENLGPRGGHGGGGGKGGRPKH